MKGHVLAFDLSVTSPGAVAIPIGWRPGSWGRVRAWLGKFRSPPKADQAAQLQRYHAIAEWACGAVKEIAKFGPIYGFVEGYSFGDNTNMASLIMESRGVVKYQLFHRHRLLLRPIAPASARKSFLGFNPTAKEGYNAKLVVQDMLFNLAQAPKKWDENQADAFVVANHGISELDGVALTFDEAQTRKRALTVQKRLGLVNAKARKPVRRS